MLGSPGARLRATLPLLLVLAALTALLAPSREAPAGAVVSASNTASAAPRPDIVLVLMDDFSLELLATMKNAQRMKAEGAWFRNAFVVDSLCCPSRAAIFTGRPPHQTGVLTNTPNSYRRPIGGYEAFVSNGNAKRSFNVALKQSGYTTGFIGKFLNRYDPGVRDGRLVAPPKVPGWTEWQAILRGGYSGWGFLSTRLDRGRVRLVSHPRPRAGDPQRDKGYATNVSSDMAVRFIEKHRDDRNPYFLEVSVYGPHARLRPAYSGEPQYPAAMADRPRAGRAGNCGLKTCSSLRLRDLVGYGDPRRDNVPTYLLPGGGTRRAPAWRTNEVRLTDEQALRRYRDRARMVQSIDRMIGRIRRAVGPETYVVLTADNGFHLGQHRLDGGKGTPYDSDTRVPLIVVGPDVVPGRRNQFVNNIDLAPTFERLAGLRPASYRSGTSFADTLSDPGANTARYAFFEHTYARSAPGEVDLDMGSGGTIDLIPSFVAVRGERGLLVRFDLDRSWRGKDHAWELYRYDRPFEDVNVFATDHRKPWAKDLMRRLRAWVGCTPSECRAAAR